ncbi:MAG TPA: hypothetical protein PKC18_08290, partial [Lacipirellulaceae bacterium]|nr:hypothetical protein [Lacipirellulaceae bacterium]
KGSVMLRLVGIRCSDTMATLVDPHGNRLRLVGIRCSDTIVDSQAQRAAQVAKDLAAKRT